MRDGPGICVFVKALLDLVGMSLDLGDQGAHLIFPVPAFTSIEIGHVACNARHTLQSPGRCSFEAL